MGAISSLVRHHEMWAMTIPRLRLKGTLVTSAVSQAILPASVRRVVGDEAQASVTDVANLVT